MTYTADLGFDEDTGHLILGLPFVRFVKNKRKKEKDSTNNNVVVYCYGYYRRANTRGGTTSAAVAAPTTATVAQHSQDNLIALAMALTTIQGIRFRAT